MVVVMIMMMALPTYLPTYIINCGLSFLLLKTLLLLVARYAILM